MSTYQLQARSAGSGGWFPATVSPVGGDLR